MKNWKLWLLCLSVYLCSKLGSLVSPIVQVLSQSYPDVPIQTIRAITTVPSLMSFTVALFIAAMIGRKIPYKTAMLLGIGFCLVGGIMPAFLNSSFALIIFGRAIYGIGFSFFGSRNAMVAKMVGDKEAPKWIGYGTFLAGIVSIFIQMLSGYLGDINWRYSFLLHGICLLPLLIVLFLYTEPEKTADTPEKKAASGKKALEPRVCLFFFFNLLGVLCLYPIVSSISIFVAERGLGGAAQSGMVSSAYTLGGVIIALVFGYFYTRYNRWSINFAFLGIILGYSCILAAGNLPVVIVGSALCGAGFIFSSTAFAKWAMDAASDANKPFAATLISCSTALGSFLSSYFMVLAKSIGSHIPLFETECEKTFLIGILFYLIIFIIMSAFDIRPDSTKAMNRA